MMAINLDEIDAMDVDPATVPDVDRRRSDVLKRLDNHARTSTYQAPKRDASPKAIGYVMVLLRKLRDHNPDVEAVAREYWMKHAIMDTDDATRVIGSDLSAEKVSQVIEKLKGHLAAPGQPAQNVPSAPSVTVPHITPDNAGSPFHVALEAIPEGRYALPVLNDDGTPDGDKHRYFKIATGKRSGRKYMVEGRAAGGTEVSWGGLVAFEHGALSIARRLADDWATAMVLYGTKTSHCGDCGRALTNDESRAIGIGPFCRGKAVWAGTAWYDGDTPTRDRRAKGEARYVEPAAVVVVAGTPAVVVTPKATGNRIDHTSCTHPRTPAGRAACRAARAS
jgi:hypothetical protein